jgi:hypothetical protein
MLVLAFHSDVQGSYDSRTVGMCGEAVMVEPWEGVGEAVTAETHKAQDGASYGV